MESLFTCSPHSITPFTRSQLTSFPNYWLQYSSFLPPFFFVVVHTRGHFDCTPQHFSHSPAHLSAPPTPIRIHTYIHDEKEETHGNMGPATHTLLIISSLTHNHKGTYFEITRLLPFPLCITCNNRNRLKRPAGGFLLLQSAVTSAPITAEHRSVLKVKSVYRQSGAEHLLISACGCVSVAGEVNDMLV